MSKKEKFIEDVENLIEQLSDEGREYFEELKKTPFTPKGISDKGKVILKDMQENNSEGKIFTSKEIADRLGIGGRSVSGSMRSLISLGHVIKNTTTPVSYSLTIEGATFDLDK